MGGWIVLAMLGAVGQPASPWQLVEWDGAAPRRLEQLRGQVVVVRFWTNTCPYCARSLPALQQLADELRGRPVQFVGIYHSKPRGSERPWKEGGGKGPGARLHPAPRLRPRVEDGHLCGWTGASAFPPLPPS